MRLHVAEDPHHLRQREYKLSDSHVLIGHQLCVWYCAGGCNMRPKLFFTYCEMSVGKGNTASVKVVILSLTKIPSYQVIISILWYVIAEESRVILVTHFSM